MSLVTSYNSATRRYVLRGQDVERIHIRRVFRPTYAPVHGYLFGLYQKTARLHSFKPTSYERHLGFRWVKIVDVRPRFDKRSTLESIHHAVVSIEDFSFYVYGYTNSTLPRNAALARYIPNIAWNGDIAVFPIGASGRLVKCPRGVKMRDITDAACLFVTRIQELKRTRALGMSAST